MAADDEAAGDLLLKLQEGGSKAQVRRPQGAQLQEAIATATAAVASCIPSSTTRQVAAVAVVSLSASASRNTVSRAATQVELEEERRAVKWLCCEELRRCKIACPPRCSSRS